MHCLLGMWKLNGIHKLFSFSKKKSAILELHNVLILAPYLLQTTFNAQQICGCGKVRKLMEIWLTTVPNLQCGLLCYGTVGSIILQQPTASTFKLPKFRNNSLPLSTANQHFGWNCYVHLQGTNTLEEPTVSISKVPVIWRNLLCASSREQHFETTCCPCLQGTNILNKATAFIFKLSILWRYPLSAPLRHQYFERFSKVQTFRRKTSDFQ